MPDIVITPGAAVIAFSGLPAGLTSFIEMKVLSATGDVVFVDSSKNEIFKILNGTNQIIALSGFSIVTTLSVTDNAIFEIPHSSVPSTSATLITIDTQGRPRLIDVNVDSLTGGGSFTVSEISGSTPSNIVSNVNVLRFDNTNGLEVSNLSGGAAKVTIKGYTNTTPVPSTVGGISAGTTFDNASLSAIVTQLLYPYQTPSFTAFSFPESTPVEIGYTISSGNKTFTWSTNNSTNISSNTIGINDSTSNIVLSSSMPNSGSAIIAIPASVQRTTNGTHVWTISAKDTQNNTLNKTYTINWLSRVYYGESAFTALTSVQSVTGLRASNLQSGSSSTYSFNAGDYKYIAYPSSYTTLTTFVDQATMLNVAMEPLSVFAVTNTYGITANYNIHRTTNKLGGTINIIAS